MRVYAYAVLAAGWAVWVTPFVLAQRGSHPPGQLDRRARWGILLVAISFSILWQSRFWERPLPVWQTAFSILFFLLAGLLSWTGTRALGRLWRLDAGLDQDHELVTWGPYRIVRHPIYTSMFCILAATGLLITPLGLFFLALVVFVAGTEVRVRVEDNLLASRFGDRFEQYRRAVSAYIPLIR